MDIEPGESSNRTLNRLVAVTVVALSVFMAIMGIKSGNTAQAIDQTKSDVVNKWSQYQAARLKHDIAEAALTTDRLVAAIPGVDAKLIADERDKALKAIEAYTASEKRYSSEARELQGKLEGLNKRDDQYDVAEAMLSIALAVSAIGILAESWGMLIVGWLIGGTGIGMGVAAMRGLDIYPEWLVQLIT